MKCNVGKTDKIIRIVVGLALIAYGIIDQCYLVAAIGLIPLITGIVSFCPLYSIFGINTQCNKEETGES